MRNKAVLSVGESGCAFSFEISGSSFSLNGLRGKICEWLTPSQPSAFLGVTVNGRHYTAQELTCLGKEESQPVPGIRQTVFRFEGQGWELHQTVRVYAGFPLMEVEPRLVNNGDVEIVVERIDSLDLTLKAEDLTLMGFSGNWGSEFEPLTFKPYQPFVLESRSGRSSKGHHPWTALVSPQGEVLSAAVAWSGNWVMRFEPLQGGALRFSGGLHDWLFSKRLKPGEAVHGVPLVLVMGQDLNEISRHLSRVGRRFWYPRNALSLQLPVEWNHWWPYEDVEINEEVFLANARKAAELGFEVCTLDAGWFGPGDAGTFWYDYRGDWHRVNTRRFPHGIRFLSDAVHALGMKFGIWCEIEALGEKASLSRDRPDLPARRDGVPLGYVCMGNPAAQEWAFQTLSRLIREWGCDWIKLDFNLDPGAGCNRTDHGHQEGDGLYEHYRGYYQMLTRLRQEFPDVVLENCSSGGLRIDLGMLRQTHMTFLSDPDWAVHDLQIFWGASTMLAPSVLLHWTYSHWRNIDPPPQQRFDPLDPALTRAKWDYYTRISMLGWYGLSQKLSELPAWLAERVAQHNRLYQNEVRRFIRDGDLHRLTTQPLRSGMGDRWAAFQYSLPDESEHLLFVFRLPGGEPRRVIRLADLQASRRYRVFGLEGEVEWYRTGRSLMEEGLEVDFLQEEESLLLKIVSTNKKDS
ncbi:alpha-galactosidase [Anaerolinea sp.]|nr:alpha-galactosidase [uncultured Anaerolinea sp.]